MFPRLFSQIIFLLGLIAVATFPTAVFADKTHEGTIVSVSLGSNVTEGKLVLKDKDNKEHSHAIFATAKITLDKKDAILTDLRKEDVVKVTTDDKGKVTVIEASREKK